MNQSSNPIGHIILGLIVVVLVALVVLGVRKLRRRLSRNN